MASVDDVKGAIEDVVPGRGARRRRLPAALVMAALAGLVAWASRLEPVRAAVHSAISGARARLASISGGADEPAPTAGEGSPAPNTSASDLAASQSSTDAPVVSDSGAESPVGIGFDDAAVSSTSPETIPADTEEGRPAGV